ncbi:alpha/beta fold hydrolase [Nocardia lijiangensis]|uniref:alpha/beta fold hydrolase n=1 Tax=Nocardia lijiangensis TaxID=299618 RepID=UPI000836AE95|nr:alpha/beta fold hydrolase [Nocardia lijiangensis]
MKFLFDDESFSFEALRTAGHGCYGGAELGEVLVTCRNIPEGDEAAWCREWSATAERVHRIGSEARAAGRLVSAREALLRASNYYRNADFYRREDPDNDTVSARLAMLSRQTFATAAELFDHPPLHQAIPYEGGALPGYLFRVDDSGEPRPTVILHGGFDSTLEELYFFAAEGAVRRGYHVLAFEGPGQASARRESGLVFRPDWERVVTPVVDHAITLPGVDPARLVLFGTSLGGYLAARAAAFEHRFAACVLHDGVYSFHEAYLDAMPPFLYDWIIDKRDDLANPVLQLMMALSTQSRWAVRNGMWTFGAASPAEYIRMTQPYTLDGLADKITCPTLVLEAENDQFFRGQPVKVHDALRCEKELMVFAAADGGGEHCHEGATQLFNQQTFDWLDTRLGR